MEWMIMPLKRYADFAGRSRRKEYWMFTLMIIIVSIGLALIGGAAFGFSHGEPTGLGILSLPMLFLFLLFTLALVVPSLAVQVRRFHDQDKSGWFVLLNLVPYIGGLVVLVFMCLEGTKGANRYGEDPKAGDRNGFS